MFVIQLEFWSSVCKVLCLHITLARIKILIEFTLVVDTCFQIASLIAFNCPLPDHSKLVFMCGKPKLDKYFVLFSPSVLFLKCFYIHKKYLKHNHYQYTHHLDLIMANILPYIRIRIFFHFNWWNKILPDSHSGRLYTEGKSSSFLKKSEFLKLDQRLQIIESQHFN